MAALNEQIPGPEAPTDSFKSHLVALLSFYEQGPHSDVPTFKYEGAIDLQTEIILRSLDAIAKRMWVAEGMVNVGARSPLDDSKVAELGYQFVHHSEASSPIEGAEDGSNHSVTATAAATYEHCPTCGNASIREPLFLHNIAGVPDTYSPPAVPSASIAEGNVEDEMNTDEELKMLKTQLSDVARVCDAVSRGDLSQKITTAVNGAVMIQLKETVDNMVDNLAKIVNNVICISQDMGTDGKLGSEIFLPNVGGTLGDMVSNVNRMASNITFQVRSISEVAKAIYLGDLSKQIEIELRGEMLDLKYIVNGIVLRQRILMREVCRVTLEIGSLGRLGGRAEVPDAEGVWLELVRNVNGLSSNITNQVRSMYQVLSCVALGDLDQSVQVHAEGEMSALKATINVVVMYLGALVKEISRVSYEIGTRGVMGGQVKVEGLLGTWAELIRDFNTMANSLTSNVRATHAVTKAIAAGDLSKRVATNAEGELLALKTTVNLMADRLENTANEIIRVNLEVGTEGMLGGRALVPDAQGLWEALVCSVNGVAATLTNYVRTTSEVTKAVAGGDLTARMQIDDVCGEMLELKETVNGAVEFLTVYAEEVTRVTRAVGAEGRLGHRAVVPHVGGTWKELVDSVNVLSENVTLQMRTAAVALTAVARGDLSLKIENVALPGEMSDLAQIINDTIDRLVMFVETSKRIVREGDTEGLLVQVEVRSVIGIWDEITKILAVEFDKKNRRQVGDEQDVHL